LKTQEGSILTLLPVRCWALRRGLRYDGIVARDPGESDLFELVVAGLTVLGLILWLLF